MIPTNSETARVLRDAIPMDIQFDFTSRAFLERATALIAQFDRTEDAALLFYAALELRNGIEARLWEYVNYQAPGSVREREYKANKLLAALRYNAWPPPPASAQISLWYATSEGHVKKEWSYVPPSEECVRMHGRLGDYLHASLFFANPQIGARVREVEGQQSFLDIREDLRTFADELLKLTTGNMLGPFDLAAHITAFEEMIAHQERQWAEEADRAVDRTTSDETE